MSPLLDKGFDDDKKHEAASQDWNQQLLQQISHPLSL